MSSSILPMKKKESDNWITGYSANLSLRHLAETFEDRLRERKIQEKQLAAAVQTAELLKIKTQCHKIFFDAVIENVYKPCTACCPRKNIPNLTNFCIDVLDSRQLCWLRCPGSTGFLLSKSFFSANARSIDCTSQVFKNQELQYFIEEFTLHCQNSKMRYHDEIITSKMMDSWTNNAVNNFSHIFSSLTFKLIANCCYQFSRKFIQKLIVSFIEVEDIKVNRDPIPILYIVKPGARFDWFLVLCILYFLKVKTPIVFLPKKLRPRFRWLRWIYRKLGVTFLNLPETTKKNVKTTIYEEIWFTYMEENLKTGNHLLVYMDTENDKNGTDYILECAVDTLKRNVLQDIFVAPVGFNYEKPFSKVTEEEWRKKPAWLKCWYLLRRNIFHFGFVKVAFNTPYSMLDMMSKVGTKEEIAPYNPSEVKYDPNSFLLTGKISKHLAYDFCRSEILMSTNVISFLLLKKFRRGVKFDDLVNEVESFRSLLDENRIRVGFTGNSKNVVNHALNQLGPELVDKDFENVGIIKLGSQLVDMSFENDGIIKPVLKLPHILDVSRLCDITLHQFMFDAVIMKSIALMLKRELEEAFQGHDRELKFYYQDLMEKAKELCDILQFEYVFEKPCDQVDSELADVFFKYTTCNYFSKIEQMLTEEEEWANRCAKRLEIDFSGSEDDEEYSISRGPIIDRGDPYLINYQEETTVLKDILFYESCLKPILDAYTINAGNLTALIGKQVVDMVYYRIVIQKMHKMLAEKQLEYPESISIDILRNSMNLFKSWGVIEIIVGNGIKLFRLTPCFNNVEKISIIVQKLTEFQ